MKKMLVVLVAVLCFTSSAFAEPWRVFDNTGLFGEGREIIEHTIFNFQRETNCDFVILTMDDYFGENVHSDIVNTFYHSNNFGVGTKSNGFVYYFTLYNGLYSPRFQYYGELSDILTDEKCDEIWALCSSFLDKGDVIGSALSLIESVTEAVTTYKNGVV